MHIHRVCVCVSLLGGVLSPRLTCFFFGLVGGHRKDEMPYMIWRTTGAQTVRTVCFGEPEAAQFCVQCDVVPLGRYANQFSLKPSPRAATAAFVRWVPSAQSPFFSPAAFPFLWLSPSSPRAPSPLPRPHTRFAGNLESSKYYIFRSIWVFFWSEIFCCDPKKFVFLNP